MQHPFPQLQSEYNGLLAQMVITREAEVDYVVEKRKGNIPSLIDAIDAGHYDAGCKQLGVPIAWAAASFEREASTNFKLNPAQGWPLTSKSKWVPYNGPFEDWGTAQIAAYRIDGLDKVGAVNWTWARDCYEGEAFNGFGYRGHGIHTPYLWAGTNIYVRGKYVADSQWSATEVDQQLGIIPMMARIIQLRPQLALVDSFPGKLPVVAAPSIIAPPAPVPFGLHNAKTLQVDLNKIGFSPRVTVDGSYGRETRRAVAAFQQHERLEVDGIAGDKTWARIGQVLAETGNA